MLLTILLAASAHLANIQTARTDDWTAFQNPACLDQTERFQISAQYDNRYLLSALNTAQVQFGYCNPYVNVGIGYCFYGYSKYQEMQVGLSLSRRFGRFTLGLGANYQTIYAGDNLKYKGTFFPLIGATVDITNQFTLGVFTSNPFMQKIRITDDEKQALPAIYSIGTDYRFYKGFHWSVQGDYDPTSTWKVATSIEWQCVEAVNLKIGTYYCNRLVGCLGIGLRFGGFGLDTNVEVDPRLGVSLQVRIGYKIL